MRARTRRSVAMLALAVACIAIAAGCHSPAAPAVTVSVPGPASVYGYRVVNVYPHDAEAFTEGLVFVDGALFESTGLNGRSSVREVELETGRVARQQGLDAEYFGEGLAERHGQLVQLTWQSHVAIVYDLADLERIGTFEYSGEGWGLAYDGQQFILSDGTDTLRFLDPETFSEVGRVAVTSDGAPVRDLNELEYVDGEIWANVWHTDRIARISPQSGRVLGWVDLAGLLPAEERSDPEAVLNGIAYDAATGRLLVTGKLWPSVFEIEVVPPQ
jgi:glutaminyl-peptide cyclotransferase